jgi:Ca-activated chloride channel family protein
MGLLAAMMLFLWSEPSQALDLMDHHAASISEGADLYRAGQYDAALEAFQQARSRRPDDPRLALAVGETLWRLERYEDANREFERAVALTDDPSLEAEGHYNAGTSALSAGDPEAATQALQKAAALAPGQSDILKNLEIAQTQFEQAQQQQEQSDEQEQNDQQDEDQQNEDQENQDQQDQQSDDQQGDQQQEQDQDQQEQDEQQDQDQQQQEQDQQDEQEKEEQQQEQSEQEQPDEQEMSRQRAEEILKSLDRDEEELKRSIPKRLQGTQPRSGRKW